MRARGAPVRGHPSLLLLLPPLLLATAEAPPWGRAAPCVSGGLPKPTNVTFISINMKNILQWSPPEELQGAEVTYTVQYFIPQLAESTDAEPMEGQLYGQKKWLSKPECRNINRTYCDLSAETSDYEHQYYAKVKAIWETNCSKWAETARFYPLLETQIGPPEVALTTGEKSIAIVLTAPEKWKRNPEDGTVSMQQIYSNLKYNVSVYNTKSKRTWSQCITNHTLVLSWLEPSTLYCVHVESFVPGPPRLTQPSQKQCVRTLEDQASALKVRIIFCYVLPTSVAMFLFSVIGYSIYRYIHVGKEKHPANLIQLDIHSGGKMRKEKPLRGGSPWSGGERKDDNDKEENGTKVEFKPISEAHGQGSIIHLEEQPVEAILIYGSEIGKRFFVPTEKLMINFITVNLLDDSKIFQKDTSFQEKRIHELNLHAPEHSGSSDSLPEEVEVLHLGYVSHLMDVFRDTEENSKDASPGREEWLSSGLPAGEVDISEEYHVPADFCQECADHQDDGRQEATSRGTLAEQLSSHTPQLSYLHGLVQEQLGLGEGPEEEEPSTTVVNWDPQTGRLCITSILDFDQDSGHCEHHTCDCDLEEGLLSRLDENPVQNKPPEENEDCFLQFMEDWGLHVQMEN